MQANLVVLPRDWAFDFLLFCQRNPKPCPLLDVTEPGDPEPKFVAAGSDLRTDLPAYRVWKNGELVEEPTDITPALARRPRVVRHRLLVHLRERAADRRRPGAAHRAGRERADVPHEHRLPTRRAGSRGPMVVSMRPLTPDSGDRRRREICSRFPRAHGAPVHFGDPAAIGIRDIDKPDFGDPVEIRPGEVPVFWACGVTPQAVLMQAKPPFAITHKPGHMFLTDLRDVDLEGE